MNTTRILQEYNVGKCEHLEQVANIGVIVDNVADGGDETHDLLGHVVGGGGLAAEDDHARHEGLALLRRGLLDGIVPGDDGDHVHVLALVLVDALDLHVEHGGRWHRDARDILRTHITRHSEPSALHGILL